LDPSGKLCSVIIDVWMQHLTLHFLAHDMFASLRRWTGQGVSDEEPAIDATLAAMDDAGISFGLLSAWSADERRAAGLLLNRALVDELLPPLDPPEAA